jgi:hypothetical protein
MLRDRDLLQEREELVLVPERCRPAAPDLLDDPVQRLASLDGRIGGGPEPNDERLHRKTR